MRGGWQREVGGLVVGAWLGVAALLGACSAPIEEDPQLVAARAQLDEGIEYLQVGAYDTAREVLADLIDPTTDVGAALAAAADPNLVDQARLAYVLADLLAQANVWVGNLAQIFELASVGFPAASGTLPTGGTGVVASLLNQVLQEFYNFFERDRRILDAIKANPGFRLVLTRLPVRFQGVEVMDAGGEYDLGEVYFLDAVYNLIEGVLSGALAIDFTVELNKAIPYIIERIGEFSDTNDQVGLILNVAGVIFFTQERFLGLADVDRMQRAGEHYADAFDSFLKALQTMRNERDDQDDDVVGHYTEGGQERLVVHIEPKPLPIPGVDVTKLEELPIELDPDIEQSITNIRDAFDGVGGKRISWARDIVPLLALATVTLLKSGAFDGLIFSALESSENIDENLKQSLRELIASDIVDANLIEGLILGVIPDVFEFDVATYFRNPIGPRDFVPFWTVPAAITITDPTTGAVTMEITWEDRPELLTEVTWLIEFECDDGDGDLLDLPINENGNTNLYCPPATGSPRDSQHFTAGPVTTARFQEHPHVVNWLSSLQLFADDPARMGIPADGLDSLLPILPLRSPSLGGMLYINLDPAIQASEAALIDDYLAARGFERRDWVLADNFTLYALGTGLLSNLLEFIPIAPPSP